MNCCEHCDATEEVFGPEKASRDLKRYAQKGPDKTTELMLSSIRKTKLKDAQLLDIGGGIGVLHHELFKDTIIRAIHVDASSAFIGVAREQDQVHGKEAQVDYIHGDVVDLSSSLPTSQIVTLDRVICCYPDWENLVKVTAEKAEDIYIFSIPRDRWFVKMVIGLENLYRRIKGDAFRAFVHSSDELNRLLGEMGFKQLSVDATLSWQVFTFTR
ncbi:MAG: methyltransferase domain-containing protein [Candidatus Marinimicrobia bacterium]|jgi:magnesium-protoporphyrin O-methyltransferase|nr:methyltransferase domain-containing protein [Candidatus Neomarinimicrobiota bacterium]MBT3575981.1 methyltransferase domain-containing protein [Candidatus Neomarinimicrobiota bacterium]MBT3679767.1 methyltransferase domain-containing protein [Candidatus Neomarinimicrobiota bacterium]MBT3950444.1 methyltransferase domain-containing protein [Candidatus Neomarinimicrobiota bacterium]MBT4253326.1 methyltransferase domain-containing protein [Candidatus Neomarinimicrobiota bacterium]